MSILGRINKPFLVFVDVKKNKTYLGGIRFDYVEVFSRHEKFKQAWKPYRYLISLHEDLAYDFNVYQRQTY